MKFATTLNLKNACSVLLLAAGAMSLADCGGTNTSTPSNNTGGTGAVAGSSGSGGGIAGTSGSVTGAGVAASPSPPAARPAAALALQPLEEAAQAQR